MTVHHKSIGRSSTFFRRLVELRSCNDALCPREGDRRMRIQGSLEPKPEQTPNQVWTRADSLG